MNIFGNEPIQIYWRISQIVMIHRQKTQYSDRYKKKLHTESISMTDFSNFKNLSKKIELAVKNAEQQSLSSHRKMIEAQQRKQQMEKRHMESRDSLRSNLQQKARSSQSNISRVYEKKKKERQNKHKFQKNTRQRIKSIEKQFLDQSFRRSVKQSTQSKKFFEEKSKRQKQKYQRLQTMHKSSRMQTANSDRSNTVEINYLHKSVVTSKKDIKCVQPRILKVDDDDIKKHQNKKIGLQTRKYSKNLAQYIEKMNDINAIKGKMLNRSFVPKPTLPKIKKDSLQNNQSIQHYSKSKQISHNNSPVRSAISNRVSFSELYSKKLKEKRQKKQLLHNMSVQQGDQISHRQKYISQKNKQFKIIRETVNQVKRKCHFNYMKILHKRY